MRLKHRPWGDEFLKEHPELIKTRENINDSSFDEFLKRDKVSLEIGVGRGDFILNMAKNNLDTSFLGVELSGMALAIAGKKIIQENVENLLLVNMDVHYLFEKMGDESFDTIYLNFSDPWPKKRQNKRRLTYPTCLKEYLRVLKPGGKVIFKTDNDVLFEDSVEYFDSSEFNVISIDRDYQLEDGDQMTEYEAKFRGLGTKIKRLIAVKKVNNMNVKANLFYNYHTVGDVLMAIIDNEKIKTHSRTENNITLIYNNEDLIGINFFKISEICKIKSKGKIVLPPNALIDMLNSLLLQICDYQLEYINDSMFVVGKVLTCEEHPESSHLHVLTVDIGSEVLPIVCGARNVKEGILCVVAKVGAMMHTGALIKPGKLLGEVSNGMCCSPRELGMDIEYPLHHILILDEKEVKVGQDFFLSKGGF